MVKYKIMSDKDLQDLLVDLEAEDPWKLIDETKERIKYFNFGEDWHFKDQKSYYFCALLNDKIIGCARVKTGGQSSLSHPGWRHWLTFISVDPEYQSQGIARRLIDQIMYFCSKENIHLLISSYSQQGFDKIRRHILFYAEEYNTAIKESSTKPDIFF